MIYIVEIPHQMPPSAWCRYDEQAVKEVIQESSDRIITGTFEDYIAENGHDLSAQLVFMSSAEARAALADDSEWRRVQNGIKARIALEKCIEDYGE